MGKEKAIYISMAIVILITIAVFTSDIEEKKEKTADKKKLNEIYEFSISSESETVRVLDPEITGLSIMYFHMLLDEVDEDTFFYLKETTINKLENGLIDAYPEDFEKSKIDEIKVAKTAALSNVIVLDELILYEVEIANQVIKFKYLMNEKRLFSELKEVSE